MHVSAEARERAAAALVRLAELLGPSGSAAEPADTDAVALEQRVEDGLGALGRMVPSCTGPEATAVALLALELAEVKALLADERTARRLDGVLQVQRALAHLPATGSTEQMLTRAPDAVCTYCGFKAAILWRVEDGVVTPVSAYSVEDPHLHEKVRRFCAGLAPIRLDAMVLENDILRRRSPLLVHDALNDPRVIRELTRASGIRSYVAAAVMPEGRVIGFPHASTLAVDDVLDRDVLWAFAEGYGYALERTILLRRLHDHGERIRDLVHSTEAALTQLREAGLQISTTSAGPQDVESGPVRSAMFSAPRSPGRACVLRKAKTLPAR
ncbi:GAF domain-containing protein [Streptomyces sp. RB17]|uniref:GAF domain-containing protein n=1 Tax=Streptomyces sp. RB17 TaxID=2585197 RepID=UPI001294FB37|nr:GAF domain-containing protein [Streptomyces sp. RB17]